MIKCDRCHEKGDPCPSVEQWLDDKTAKIHSHGIPYLGSHEWLIRVGTEDII